MTWCFDRVAIEGAGADWMKMRACRLVDDARDSPRCGFDSSPNLFGTVRQRQKKFSHLISVEPAVHTYASGNEAFSALKRLDRC